MNTKYTVAAILLAAMAAAGCGQSAPPAPQSPAGGATASAPVTTGEGDAAQDSGSQAENAPVVIGDALADEAKKEPELPEIVAKVNDEPIMGKQFARQLAAHEQMMGAHGMTGKPGADQRREVLNAVIDEKVLSILAKQAGIATSEEEAKAELEKAKAQMPSEDFYKQYLESQGMTEDDLLALIRNKLDNQKFMEAKTADLTISDEELKAEYEKYKAAGQMERPEATTDVAHILVKVDGKDEAAWAAGKEKIDAARARIVGGESFAAVAKDVSDDPGSKDRGGAYPNTPKGKMVPEFEEKMASTPIGEISDPFKTTYGWHILTVTGKHEAGTVALEEIKDDLQKYMLSKKRYEAVKQIVADARPTMKIEIFLDGETPPAETPPAEATPETPDGENKPGDAAPPPEVPEAPTAQDKPDGV